MAVKSRKADFGCLVRYPRHRIPGIGGAHLIRFLPKMRQNRARNRRTHYRSLALQATPLPPHDRHNKSRVRLEVLLIHSRRAVITGYAAQCGQEARRVDNSSEQRLADPGEGPQVSARKIVTTTHTAAYE